MTEIHIRQARLADEEKIIAFQLAMAAETEGLELNLDILKKGVNSIFTDATKGIYYVAEINEEVVGSMLVTYEWSDWRNGLVLWFQSVYILPEHRGKGIFRKMYDFLKEKVLTDEHLKGLRLYVDKRNVNAQKVYTSLGMSGEHYATFEWMKEEM
ncbi:MAG: GNAT family N-acetyltransferase [Bacteroidetes bacterium RIFOXYA12_FULL_35_11]|nr:MAG: GNAT family N-acetyltransferase [Bacteroidetes bacterium GWF2_35_48]OFY75320.1 MAG: GNAT family N-acetyltransferase [Bacteroidetes bacterium RIFOXYA12_FULL_35_11]OFY94817.1 MAG: GNAT family N-acetyltransferase [Bacteroidetes bacterium RIFOXYC12_FULL_35_7]HBX53480.1 GNAT family N-acetyltransferase [Bacteroidales bacterium]